MTHDLDGARRAELAAFLKARRAALQPADVGLPGGGRRRVDGLRRDEVALLAGVSTAWYVELEQARRVSPTPAVLDAIAGALHLDLPAHQHLRRLGGHPVPEAPGPDVPLELGLGQLIDRVHEVPICAFSSCYDYLAWNPLYVAMIGIDLGAQPAPLRNGLMLAFSDHRSYHREQDKIRARLVAQFRYESARAPGNPRFQQIVEELGTRSAAFVAEHARHEVYRSIYAEPTVIDHPVVGEVHLNVIQLRPLLNPDTLVSIHVPVGEADVEALARLRCAQATTGAASDT